MSSPSARAKNDRMIVGYPACAWPGARFVGLNFFLDTFVLLRLARRYGRVAHGT